MRQLGSKAIVDKSFRQRPQRYNTELLAAKWRGGETFHCRDYCSSRNHYLVQTSSKFDPAIIDLLGPGDLSRLHRDFIREFKFFDAMAATPQILHI